MDFIRPIGADRDLDPVTRVERLKDEREERERQGRERRRARPGPQTAGRRPQESTSEPPQGPVEGDDGHLHIDVTA
jgi:hypothetical protein